MNIRSVDGCAGWPKRTEIIEPGVVGGEDHIARQDRFEVRTAVGVEAWVRSCHSAVDRNDPT
jgi:hypothetical protein